MDYVRVALAIETLAYHNKNYLSRDLADNAKISEEIQALLQKAIALDAVWERVRLCTTIVVNVQLVEMITS